jgi:hypothetical protein
LTTKSTWATAIRATNGCVAVDARIRVQAPDERRTAKGW